MRIVIASILLIASALSVADTLYVTEYRRQTANYQAAYTPPEASQAIAITAVSAQSAAFSALTQLVRIHTDVVACVEVGGTNPTATTSSARMVAGQTEYFVVAAGQKVAARTCT
jgi:hypothetical protein